MRNERPGYRPLQCVTGYYSFLWLLLANLVGLWLAVLLLWPGLGEIVGEFGYGRWMPLHMEWQLYGWCTLPLIGVLMRFFFEDGAKSLRDAHLGFMAWSGALAVLGIMCLNGVASGKLFLSLNGPSRVVFPSAMVFLLLILVGHSWRRYRITGRVDIRQWLQVVLLAGLATVPAAIWMASNPAVYPPVDPASGGATGHSLLASSLGILFVFGACPLILRIPADRGAETIGRAYAAALAISVVAWAVLGHGNESNTQPGQIAGLGVLILWIPLVRSYYGAFSWPSGAGRWLRVFIGWWALLTLTGFVDFMPGVLDRLKFTNAMVAHAHLAMAGMLSAFNMLLLGSIGGFRERDPWSDRAGFLVWNAGTLLFVVAMTLQGMREGAHPEVLFQPDRITTTLYVVRLVAGGLMVGATVRWIWLLDRLRNSRTRTATAVEGATR